MKQSIYPLIGLIVLLHSSCGSLFQASNNIKYQQKHARVFVSNTEKETNYGSETKIKGRSKMPKDSIQNIKKEKSKKQKPDIIYLRTKEKYIVKKIEVKDSTVTYQYYYHGKDTSEHCLVKTDIHRIEYANGQIDTLYNDSSPIISQKKMQQYLKRKQEPIGLIGFGVGLLSVAAFISLVILGGAGFFTILLGLTAIALGLISLRKIKRRPDKYKGRTFAILGMIFSSLILAYLVYILIFFIFFF